METYLKKSRLAAALATLAFVSGVGTAQAALFEIDYTTSGAFSGTAPSAPSDPNEIFAKAIFDDGGGTGTVTLTMSVLNNLSAGAYVNDWYFNVDTAPLSGIAFSSGTAASSVQNGTNAFKPDGSGFYDIAFHFPTNNPGELAQGHTSVYTLTGANITAASFNALSTSPSDPGHGPFISALHVQGYGNSVWIAGHEGGGGGSEIPEPATLALLGLGLLGIAATRRRH